MCSFLAFTALNTSNESPRCISRSNSGCSLVTSDSGFGKHTASNVSDEFGHNPPPNASSNEQGHVFWNSISSCSSDVISDYPSAPNIEEEQLNYLLDGF